MVVARSDIFRIWLSPDGAFTNDPAGSDLATTTDFGAVSPAYSDAGSYYRITTGALSIRVNKSPLQFSVYRADNTTPVWQETQPTSWTGTQTTQYLARGADEQFYGTGLRLGEWALRGKTVPVAVDNKWRENNNASPAPFYMSTNGYGVMRNTWAPGSYGFNAPGTFTHDEKRFDAWYFTGNSLKEVLDAYTDVSGKPFMAPMWGLELGNADCFNASNPDYQGDHNRARHQTTPDVVGYATDARAADMPSGWFLPNDGYGCGYTAPLKSTVDALRAKGFQTGLWTSTGLSGIGDEVGTAGTRGVKTDVAWIGSGYKYAFDGVKQAVEGIEKNSDARRYVWTVDGWAGTQRNAVVWTGDTHGTWDDMRWHVPAIAGAGLSGFNYASGDVDGIFGGSPKTYVRDLQWKAFTPAFMTMSGWGATNPAAGYQDKQPWRFAEPYLSVNRKYLKLKMRLMPYLYTMSRIAHESGVPSTRALVLEYPEDPVARGNLTSGQFMAGDSFLVAPVVSDTTVRDGIYLPAGTWTDYWTGKTYAGPGWLNGYAAPLDTLPLFVKGGSIVPMWPQMNHTGEKPVSTLTYDIHPRGSSSFTLYEDDGLTRAHQNGAYARQRVDVTAPATGTGDVTVSVGAANGSYAGKPASAATSSACTSPARPARSPPTARRCPPSPRRPPTTRPPPAGTSTRPTGRASCGSRRAASPPPSRSPRPASGCPPPTRSPPVPPSRRPAGASPTSTARRRPRRTAPRRTPSTGTRPPSGTPPGPRAARRAAPRDPDRPRGPLRPRRAGLPAPPGRRLQRADRRLRGVRLGHHRGLGLPGRDRYLRRHRRREDRTARRADRPLPAAEGPHRGRRARAVDQRGRDHGYGPGGAAARRRDARQRRVQQLYRPAVQRHHPRHRADPVLLPRRPQPALDPPAGRQADRARGGLPRRDGRHHGDHPALCRNTRPDLDGRAAEHPAQRRPVSGAGGLRHRQRHQAHPGGLRQQCRPALDLHPVTAGV